MHPTCKTGFPPRKGSFLHNDRLQPRVRPARIAATYPPGPPPDNRYNRTFATRSLPSTRARTGDQTWWSDCRHTSVTARRNSRGSGQKGEAPVVRLTDGVRKNVRLTNAIPKRTKKAARALRRRRLRPSKQEILNSRSPPLATLLGACFYAPGCWAAECPPHSGEDKENFVTPRILICAGAGSLLPV